MVDGYKKIENSVVDGFTNVTDKCVEKMFAKDGETVEEDYPIYNKVMKKEREKIDPEILRLTEELMK